MGDLNTYAELELTFSSVLTNILHVEAHLYQHQDKTTSAAIKFNEGFLVLLFDLCMGFMQTYLFVDSVSKGYLAHRLTYTSISQMSVLMLAL